MHLGHRGTTLTVLGLALVGVVLRLPFLGVPAGNDEAGFLVVARSWDRGSSLYGDYWVDRPPLLLWIFDLAGDLTTLRVLGCVAAAATIVLVAAAAATAGGRAPALAAATTAAVLCASPWLGTARVNGELLAAPFVAASLLGTLLALNRPVTSGRWAVAAGAAAAAALAIKQSTVDGFVFAVVLLAVLAWSQPTERRRATRILLGGVLGALTTVGVLALGTVLRGTDLLDLVDALVVFRVDAGRVIGSSASGATDERLLVLLATWAVSGIAMITVGVLVLSARRRREPAVVATAATLVAASAVALLGGSYWAHYLVQLVPAAALGAGLLVGALGSWPRRVGAVALGSALAVTLGYSLSTGSQQGSDAEQVGRAVRDAAELGDTMVVAYGQPNVLLAAGMDSPYENLWSLPIRVRDPDLAELVAVLQGPNAPTWVVEWSDFDTWAVDPTALKLVVDDRYRPVAVPCGHVVWLRADLDRGEVAERVCR
ncbi:hypothetical protein [Aeromicrobium alkaliterrae]|uniref:Glycosyltransferase RgtA/B/C/D-like domain-containing protein n=1 Tax=Aeromicrobium alkaliterrae TaxID=302168 RepID=A0ABP4VT40_9ACTN